MDIKHTDKEASTEKFNVILDPETVLEAKKAISVGSLFEAIEGATINSSAVQVAVTGIKNGTKLTYNDGTNTIEFKYSAEITAKTGVSTYVAIVDEAIAMESFVNESNFSIPGGDATAVTFGDTNGDGVINAQDALAVVDTWLRKGEDPTDDQILTMNVNGDSRINTFDALGIVEKFVDGSDFGVVTKAATITTNP